MRGYKEIEPGDEKRAVEEAIRIFGKAGASWTNAASIDQSSLALHESVQKLEKTAGPDFAREILGADYIGLGGVCALEETFVRLGVNVEFDVWDLPEFPYTKNDILAAKACEEMLVLRPSHMKKDGVIVPVTLDMVRSIFYKSPFEGMSSVFAQPKTSTRPWFAGQRFAAENDITFGWALVKKTIISKEKFVDERVTMPWADYDTYMDDYELHLARDGAEHVQVRRRTATEAAIDTFMYYAKTGKRLLDDTYDWTRTKHGVGEYVFVGGFRDDGISVGARDEGSQNSLFFGVVPTR